MKYELDLMDARADGKAEGKAEGLKQGKVEGLKQGKEEGISATIQALQNMNAHRDQIIEQLTKNFDLTLAYAQEYYNKYTAKQNR
ncbi:hypothetical protein [Limosilactobacillus frumenti]|uniref:hypothetical protein n=1 Tax=Limosilactobacillus frumenti TaxID=104955 RepID=UPI0015EB7450|nr:hypothetical protein [Limosilactobacillus frumenti]MBA2913863.1 hypothetical protein [Limosilactobacillus frumenti]